MKDFSSRKFIIIAIFILVGLVFISRLFYIQVIDESYKLSAKNQALRTITQFPSRGLISDRDGKLLVFNEAAYDLMVVPKKVDFTDTLALCVLLNIDKSDLKEGLDKASDYSRYRPSVLLKQITALEWASISEQLYKYNGFYGEQRSLRKYPEPVAAHVLGYISEVGPEKVKKDKYYKKGDYEGVNGLENQYEKLLRGKRGKQLLMVDVHNRVKGSYGNGIYDTAAIAGKNLTTTLQRDLQVYAEALMNGKRGSVVAIEPTTGEVLALVTSPAYNPNMLVGRNRSEQYKTLVNNDSLDPLFNRALNAQYRPGSIFKLVQSLIALQEGVINVNTRVVCNRNIIGCHGSHTYDNLTEAIQHSCNPYFHQVYKQLIQRGKYSSIFLDSEYGIQIWTDYLLKFGFGQRLKIDLPGISTGLVPGKNFYNKWYGQHRWAFSTIYSNSIGEGELGVVPIQMANLASIIANRGYYITPHLIKGIEGIDTIPSRFVNKNDVGIDAKHFTPVIDAMYSVVNELGGTAGRAKIDSIDVCGKTGTVQNPNRPDHSVFIAFAPMENPKIAVSVYVEYSDFGGTWAAPIASLLIEKYLTGEISNKAKEQRILDAEFLTIYEER